MVRIANSSKLPKDEVQYSLGHANSHCGICKFFRPKQGTCTKVRGEIDPRYWCIKFKRKNAK